jgi:hypothetical protein
MPWVQSRTKGLARWLTWYTACLASVKPWV